MGRVKACTLTAILGLGVFVAPYIFSPRSRALSESEWGEKIVGYKPIVKNPYLQTEFYNDGIPLSELEKKFSEKGKRKIVIEKAKRVLQVYRGNELLKEYGVSLGLVPVGDKEKMGDKKTPEGEFYVSKKVPWSRFHLALLISYPNIEDATRGLKQNIINKSQYKSIITDINHCRVPNPNTQLGNLIEIHGSGGGPGVSDWTHGCIAMNNPDIEELYKWSGVGCDTTIHINK